MIKLPQILLATTLTLFLATVSFGSTILGSRSNGFGSRTGTIVGSRTGTIVGSRTGTIVGSRTNAVEPEKQERGRTVFQEELLSHLIALMLIWGW